MHTYSRHVQAKGQLDMSAFLKSVSQAVVQATVERVHEVARRLANVVVLVMMLADLSQCTS